MTCGRPSAWQVSRAASTASGEQQARSVVGPFGVEPEPERHADRLGAGPQERDRRVDAAAHRDRDAAGRRARAEDRPDRVRQRVDGERLAADRGRLEQRQSADVLVEPVGVGVDDPVAVQAKPDERPAPVARGVSGDLDHPPRMAHDPPPEPALPGGGQGEAPRHPPHRRLARQRALRGAQVPRLCPTLPMSPLRSEPGRTRWVPCGAARLPTHRPDTGSLAMAVGSTLARSHEQGRAPRHWVALRYPARAKLHLIGCVPLPSIPSTSASAGVTSKSRSGPNGPRSTTDVSTVFPPSSTKIFAPQGRTECPTPSVVGLSNVPQPGRVPGERPRSHARSRGVPAAHVGDCRLRACRDDPRRALVARGDRPARSRPRASPPRAARVAAAPAWRSLSPLRQRQSHCLRSCSPPSGLRLIGSRETTRG